MKSIFSFLFSSGRMLWLTVALTTLFAACSSDSPESDPEPPTPPTPPVVEEKVEVTATHISFNDIQIEVKVTGIEAYYAGHMAREAFSSEDVLTFVNDGALQVSTDAAWSGSLVEFPAASGETIEPNTTYVVWVLPFTALKDYTTEDIHLFEFTSSPIQSGSTLAITASEPILTESSVEVELKAEGANRIYHLFMAEDAKSALMSIEGEMVKELLTNGIQTEGDTATALSVVSHEMIGGETIWLAAIAVDDAGCYGPIFCQDYTTPIPKEDFITAIDYANCSVGVDSASLCWYTTGGSPATFIYYLGDVNGAVWSTTLGGTNGAAAYMEANATDANFIRHSENTIKFSGLTTGTEYGFVVAALDEEGNCSKAAVYTFTPQEKQIRFITHYLEDGSENAEWTALCPTIEIADYCFKKGQLTRLFWTVTPAAGTTAYTTAMLPDNVAIDYPNAEDFARAIIAGGGDFRFYYWEPTNPDIPNPNDPNAGDNPGQSVRAQTTEVIPGKIYYQPYATDGFKVYVTWVDGDGNIYEAHSVDMPTLSVE